MAKKSVNAGALIFRTVYVTLGIIGIIDSLGWFHLAYRGDWYVYYTNLSNYICFGIMFASLVAEARGKSVVLPRFRFYALVMIFVTLFVYNFLLADERTLYTYFSDITCTLFHCVLPIMFFVDWLFFCKRKCLKVVDPLLSTVMPLMYVAFIAVRGSIINGEAKNIVVYPYYFLDVNKLGYGGFFTWVGILVGIFIALGYLLYIVDKSNIGRR